MSRAPAFIRIPVAALTGVGAISLILSGALLALELTLVSLAVIYGVVHAVSYVRRRAMPSSPGLQPQTDLAILNWRREKSV